jgi:hypothetical protein
MNTVSHSATLAATILPRRLRGMLLLVASLLVVTVVVARGITQGELNYNVDEAQQAVTGLYFADAISDLPLTHPVQYTYHYYAQYPALGLIHWPPLFHVFEGLLFLVFGPSAVVARWGVLLFALLGWGFWYKLVAEIENEWAAALSTIFLATLPAVLVLEKTVMLEVPSMALCIGASYFWWRYLKSGETRPLYWFALLASLALLTKQQSIYLAVFCLLTILAEQKWRLLLDRSLLRALGLCLLLLVPFYAVAFYAHGQTIVHHVFTSRPRHASSYLFYWYWLPNQLGVPLLTLSAFGAATSWRWGKKESVVFMLLWVLACYVTLTFMAAQEARYIVYWLPPLVYFAVAPFTAKFSGRWLRAAAFAVLLSLVGSQVWSAWVYERPYVSGYAPIARRVAQSGAPGIVLFDGELPGNFIFYMRAYDPQRRFIVMRKALYATQIEEGFGSVELLHTREDLEQLIKSYGIRFIAVTENGPVHFEVQRTLREFLEGPQFKLLARSPISSDMPEWKGRSVLLYENTQVTPPTEQFLRVRMLTLNHDIVVPLADYQRP